MNDKGLIKVRCINYIKGTDGIKKCSGLKCVPDIMLDENKSRLTICKKPVLVDWIQYLKYRNILKIVE